VKKLLASVAVFSFSSLFSVDGCKLHGESLFVSHVVYFVFCLFHCICRWLIADSCTAYLTVRLSELDNIIIKLSWVELSCILKSKVRSAPPQKKKIQIFKSL